MMRSPLVCCSSPQMMRRKVVFPQPDGPSKTMNSPSGTVSVMPFTAATPPNILTISLVKTIAIERSPDFNVIMRPPIPRWRSLSCPVADNRHRRKARDRANARSRKAVNLGFVLPLVEDVLALLRRPLDRFFGSHRAGRRLRHHVADDELVVDIVGRGPGRSRIADSSRPRVRALQDRQLVMGVRGRIVGQDRHRLGYDVGVD